MIPRIKARVGQVDEPGHPDNDKWVFEVFLGYLGSGEDGFRQMGTWGPFLTEAEAHLEMQKCVQVALRGVAEIMGADEAKFIDMKTNEVRSWAPESRNVH